MSAMPDDFFGSIYIECEEAGNQLGWLVREGISHVAWLSYLEVLRAETRDCLQSGDVAPEEGFDAAVSSSMQVAWEGAKRQIVARLRSRMDEVLVTHGVGEMTELLARLIGELERV